MDEPSQFSHDVTPAVMTSFDDNVTSLQLPPGAYVIRGMMALSDNSSGGVGGGTGVSAEQFQSMLRDYIYLIDTNNNFDLKTQVGSHR